MVGGVALLFVLGLPFFLFWVSTFSFAGSTCVIFAKGSNWGAFAPTKSKQSEPFGATGCFFVVQNISLVFARIILYSFWKIFENSHLSVNILFGLAVT